ncbi:MAG: PAS domain S-box protein [Polyangiaceae bacterium]|nr:PAS domain S-box protein [Polyangiaceae bacterium]
MIGSMGHEEPSIPGEHYVQEQVFREDLHSGQRLKPALGLGVGEREELLEEAERMAQLGSWSANVSTGQVTWSENLLSILDYDPAFALPSTEALIARVHPDDQALVTLLIERTKLGADPQSVALRLRLPRRGERHVLLRGRAVRDSEGNVTRLVGTVLDVTERRVMEQELAKRTEELAESEARWRAIAETPFDFVVLVDEAGVYQWVNRTAEGVRAEDLIGRASIYDYIDVASQEAVRKSVASVFATGEPSYYECYVPALDKWFGSAVGAYKKAGRVELVCILTRDVTEAKRAEASVMQRARLLAEAERIAHVGSWQWEKSTDRIEWSDELKRIFGIDAGLTVTRELVDSLIVEEDRARVAEAGAQGFVSGKVVLHDYRIRRLNDGALRYVQTTGEAQRNAAGEVVGFTGATLDVTERKELEEKMGRAERLEALGRLAGGIAHDFNNVLTVILGQVELAGRGVGAESPLLDTLGTIRQASERASRMTHQLLAFARRQVLAPRAVEPRAEIQSLVRLFEPLLGENIRVILNLAEPVWSVRIDPSQLEQLVMNLVLNARDAMERGGTLTISISNTTRLGPSGSEEWVRLSVADTGSGMTEEVRRHLFDPFFTTKASGKGTGLGLATCDSVAKQAGGFIEVESELGRGSVFHVNLPRTHLPATGSLRPSEQPAGLTGTETILVVEDMGLIRKLCTRVLSGLGYTTLSAETAAEAMAALAAHQGPVHLMLTDMVLPDRPGSEIAEELLLLHPNARVLFTSGYSEITLPTHLGSRQHFLPKPYTPSSLSKKIRQILDESEPGTAGTDAG